MSAYPPPSRELLRAAGPKAYIMAFATSFPRLARKVDRLFPDSKMFDIDELMCALFIANVWNPGYADSQGWKFDIFEFLGTADDSNRRARRVGCKSGLAAMIPLAPVRFSDSFRSTMKTMTVTEAKGVLGRLVDRALKSKPVFIRRGERVVQLVPAVMPDPIEVYPRGALKRSAEQIAFLQSGPDDEAEPYRR